MSTEAGGGSADHGPPMIAAVMRRFSAEMVLFNDAVAAQLGINATDLLCLGQLDLEGPISAGRIAEITGLTSGAVTGVIDRLERAGFVQRESDPLDRRRVIVRTTGTRSLEVGALFEPMVRRARRMGTEFSSDQLGSVIAFLEHAAVVLRDATAEIRGDHTAGVEGHLSPRADAEAGIRREPLGETRAARLDLATAAAHTTLSACSASDLFVVRYGDAQPWISAVEGNVRVKVAPPRGASSRGMTAPGDETRHGRARGRHRAYSMTPVDVALNPTVLWTIRIRGGATQIAADLSGIRLADLELKDGASRIEVRLPRPTGTVTVRVVGGASHVTLTRPEEVAVRVHTRGGANDVTLDGQRIHAGWGSSTFESDDYPEATARYDVDLAGAANALSIER